MGGAARLQQSMRGMHIAPGMHLLHSQAWGWCHLGGGIAICFAHCWGVLRLNEGKSYMGLGLFGQGGCQTDHQMYWS